MHTVIVIVIVIVGPPQKCDQLSVASYDASSISVNVSCQHDGNSLITEYEIQYNTTPSENWKSVKFNASVYHHFLVQDLMAFTVYAIRVRAANKYMYAEGDVSFSDPVTVKTAEGGN